MEKCQKMVREQGSAAESKCGKKAIANGYCAEHDPKRAKRAEAEAAAPRRACELCVCFHELDGLPGEEITGECREGPTLWIRGREARHEAIGVWPRVYGSDWCVSGFRRR